MRVLFVANTLPFPAHDGGKIRRYQSLVALSSRHEVTLLAATPDRAASELFSRLHPKIRRREIPYRAGEGFVPVARAVREATRDEGFDLLHVASLWQWPGEEALGSLRVVLDAENVESRLLRRLHRLGSGAVSDLDVRSAEALERRAFERADLVLACSQQDADEVRRLAPGARVEVVPNAVDLSAFPFRPRVPESSRPVVLFTGILTYRPNVDAALHFAKNVLPLIRETLPGVRLQVVGRYPSAEIMDLADEGVEVIPDVPEILPYFQGADVFVAPLRAASGTRLKILQALAVGLPVVSTPVGCEGLEVEAGEHLEIAESADSFASAVVRLIESPQHAAEMAARGRHRVAALYALPEVRRRLLEAYESLLHVPA
jgi:glycosyltransferase involved in cell wall biosynthesis